MPINQDHHITLPEAAAMTKRFRDNNPPGTTIAFAFDRSIIDEILSNPNCQGIRIYRAIDSANCQTVVVTGTDASGNDLYNSTLAEYANKCPDNCPATNPLNC